jgi:hypothetical protein
LIPSFPKAVLQSVFSTALRCFHFYIEIYYRKLIIFLEVLKCRQSLMFQGFPAFLVTEDVLKSP